MEPALRFVVERLPQVGAQAGALFECDEAFRDLCEEYQACSEALSRLERYPNGKDALRNEYVALRLRLEGELLRYVEKSPGA